MKSLITLFIHREAYKQYYSRHDRFVEKQKKWVEDSYKKPFKELEPDRKMFWEDLWFWPPWKFNNIVGFIEIQMLTKRCMNADIFLKRKSFPRKHPWKRRPGKALENNQFEYYGDLSKVDVPDGKNSSFVGGIEEIVSEADQVIKKINKSYQILKPLYGWDCYNFQEIIKQLGI